jgi:hypothetical protein
VVDASAAVESFVSGHEELLKQLVGPGFRWHRAESAGVNKNGRTVSDSLQSYTRQSCNFGKDFRDLTQSREDRYAE